MIRDPSHVDGLVPDDPLGFTVGYLKGRSDDRFWAWHAGQTGAINDKGELVVYVDDVKRFLRGGEVTD